MAIVKMKRLRLIGMRDDREALLHLLQRLGCVEISEPEIDLTDGEWAALAKPDSQGLSRAREESTQINGALAAIKKYAPTKEKLLRRRPCLSESEFLDDKTYSAGLETAGEILDGERQLSVFKAERAKLEGQKASLEHWAALDVPLDLSGGGALSVFFGTIPARTDYSAMEGAILAETDMAQLTYASADSELQYFLLVCHVSVTDKVLEAARGFGFSQASLKDWTGTAADNIRRIDGEIAATDQNIQAETAHLGTFGPQKGRLQQCSDRAEQEIAREEAKGRLLDTEDAFFLEGWAPAEDLKTLEQSLSAYTCAWESWDPPAEEYPIVPVKLKNNLFTRPLNMVTDMYSLPAYDGLDPNPLMAFFFIFFYGFMMADMGYGLVMLIVSLVVMKKTKPKGPTMRHMIPLLGWCGVSTFIMGALTGGFFGDLIPQLVQIITGKEIALPALFSPLDNALEVLIASLVIGLVQIFTGMAVSMYKQIKRGQTMAALCNEGAWYVVFILLAVGILTNHISVALIAILVVLILTQGYGKKGIVGKIMGIGGSLYNNITGYFSDILSYSRLMALMLAGAVIAQVFNTLGAITGNVITFFIISIIGNALNFALNLLGCYVHDMRLQCLEFFSRFYEDGGKPFRPLEYNTKYVDVEK